MAGSTSARSRTWTGLATSPAAASSAGSWPASSAGMIELSHNDPNSVPMMISTQLPPVLARPARLTSYWRPRIPKARLKDDNPTTAT